MGSASDTEKMPMGDASTEAGHAGSDGMATLNVDPKMLTVADLYDKEKFDLETMDNKLVFQLLQCGPEGLTQAEATARIEKVSVREASSPAATSRSGAAPSHAALLLGAPVCCCPGTMRR
ncbi:hypothetical protein H4R19_005160 [Coemansia spiralis]|nr:hypothetical protein H4R19_005160 [Coemansia spiralis]